MPVQNRTRLAHLAVMEAPFDRTALRAHRRRAARSPLDTDFLFDEVAERLAERLDGVRRGFDPSVFWGRGRGAFRRTTDAKLGTLLAAGLVPEEAGCRWPCRG